MMRLLCHNGDKKKGKRRKDSGKNRAEVSGELLCGWDWS